MKLLEAFCRGCAVMLLLLTVACHDTDDDDDWNARKETQLNVNRNDTIKELDFRDHSEYTRQIFVSDGDIIRNPFDSKRNQPYPAGYDIYTRQTFDNTDFIVNCVNYLCADDDLLQLRAKNFKIGSLSSEKTRNHKVLLAILNIGIPLLIIALMGTVLIIIRKVRFSKKG